MGRKGDMTETAKKLRGEPLQLPSQDRAELAYCLIGSLDDKDESGTQAAWEAELERRWQEMESGAVVGESAESVFAGLRKKYP
jgi:putative addiction module component (TIGR02574 family)